jgi:NADPH-dependent 2,4-dienoyl-CoA reductase/sulfur reductase-like enzyme/rhodanese-related sulfurtransferase
MSAATRLRRLDEAAEIVVFEKSGHVSFANCGLPYFVGGVIPERQSLLLQTPASLGARFGLDVRVRHEVLSVDATAKVVRVRSLDSGEEFDEPYDTLVLSPGAAPFVPDFPGADKALRLRNIEDVDAMSAAVANLPSSAPVVILGAGFIGLEMAENLTHRGLAVTVVELADQVLAPLDPEMAALVQARLEGNHVGVRTGVQVSSFDGAEATLSDGTRLPAGLLIAAIGVRPETALARTAGLTLGARGGILVDDHQRTSDPSIFAVGDAAVKVDAITGGEALTPLASPANRHGRLVADVIAGRPVASRPVLGTAIVGVFGLQVGVTGWNEKRAAAAGRPVRIIHTHPADHAGYYPGAKGMSLKLIIDAETDAILGAQGVGEAGVDKRIDVIATAMRGGITASGLADLELSYAPQFGSAKDPINMLGYIAENLATGTTATLQWSELDAALASGIQLLDVRTPGEFARGGIPGAVNIPLDELRGRLGEVQDECIVHCQVGLRGHVAARILSQHGRSVRNLDGGYRTWARV